MPEAPELEVVKDYLVQHMVGQEVADAHRSDLLRRRRRPTDGQVVHASVYASKTTERHLTLTPRPGSIGVCHLPWWRVCVCLQP